MTFLSDSPSKVVLGKQAYVILYYDVSDYGLAKDFL